MEGSMNHGTTLSSSQAASGRWMRSATRFGVADALDQSEEPSRATLETENVRNRSAASRMGEAGSESTSPNDTWANCALAKSSTPAVQGMMIAQTLAEKEAQLEALAMELGFIITPLQRLVQELAHAIATRMCAREGVNVYQTMDFSLPCFPLSALHRIFVVKPMEQEKHQEGMQTTWCWDSFEELLITFPSLLRQSGFDCAGLSRALRTPSEPVIRVLSSVLLPGVQATFQERGGLSRLKVTAMYALVDEAGEIHPPKDGQRREIALSQETETHLRQQVLTDVTEYADRGRPLSSAFLRHLGREREALEVEAMLHNREVLAAPSKLAPAIRALEEKLGVQPSEDGRIAFKSFAVVVQEMVARDPGRFSMPSLPAYLGGAMDFPIIISFDATGFGSRQLTTIAARNPYHPQSSQMLRIFGLGNVSDNKEGTTRLLGPNLETVNKMITTKECTPIYLDGTCEPVMVKPHIYSVTDVSALRHTEHLHNSGWCGCSRDFALRQTPRKPTSIAEMHTMLKTCKSPTCEERFIRSHNPLPNETLPRPCTAPGCRFGHNKVTAATELETLYANEAELAQVTTKSGKARFAKWRKEHSQTHFNSQPGKFGMPMLHLDMDDQILDTPLHMAELGLPKTRCGSTVFLIMPHLMPARRFLDTNKKGEGRVAANKWFTGERWATSCAGERGSPGGPVAIASIVLLVAEDLQQRGIDLGEGSAKPTTTKSNSRKDKATARAGALLGGGAVDESPDDVLLAERAKLERVPTGIEMASNPDDLKVIRNPLRPPRVSRSHSKIRRCFDEIETRNAVDVRASPEWRHAVDALQGAFSYLEMRLTDAPGVDEPYKLAAMYNIFKQVRAFNPGFALSGKLTTAHVENMQVLPWCSMEDIGKLQAELPEYMVTGREELISGFQAGQFRRFHRSRP